MTDFDRFKEKIYQTFGLDLHSYKENQLKRRLDNLLTRKQYPDYQTFFNYLTSIKMPGMSSWITLPSSFIISSRQMQINKPYTPQIIVGLVCAGCL